MKDKRLEKLLPVAALGLADEEIREAQIEGHTDYIEAVEKDPNDNTVLGQEFVGRRIAKAQLAKAEPLIRADERVKVLKELRDLMLSKDTIGSRLKVVIDFVADQLKQVKR